MEFLDGIGGEVVEVFERVAAPTRFNEAADRWRTLHREALGGN